ncbi:hypothetical protein ACLMJK_005165 [Lecanora helva]
MSQYLTRGPNPPTYQFCGPQTPPQGSGAPHSGFPQLASCPPPGFPPMSTTNPYVSTQHHYGGLPYQTPSSMLMTSQAEAAGQPATFPVYPPTGNVYAHQSFHSNTHSPNSLSPPQQTPSSRLTPVHVLGQPPSLPAYAAGVRPVLDIAPMPPRSSGEMAMPFGNGANLSPVERKTGPAHVVGAQGRRGPLPSSAGRPPISLNQTDLDSSQIPLKDANGKYPCPHCEKSYLHAKHLKRHFLRHSGKRPYMCGLCSDTFSRSDILKRHFHKCSVRRGNPSGKSHLALSRAKKKSKEQQEKEKAESPATGTETVTDHPQTPYTPDVIETALDVQALTLTQPNHNDASSRASRANSVSHSTRRSGSHSNGGSIGTVNPSGYESAGYGPSTGQVTPDSVTTSGAATPYEHHHEQRGSHFLENGALSHVASADFSYYSNPASAPSAYTGQGPLPHIVNHEHARGPVYGWSSQTSHYHPHEDYANGRHHSGASTPLEHDKPDTGFANLPFSNFNFLNQQP